MLSTDTLSGSIICFNQLVRGGVYMLQTVMPSFTSSKICIEASFYPNLR